MVDTKNTYWSGTGKFMELADQLQALIPMEGPVKGSKNKALERFRKAVNCYYDLYNNGLCNRARSFSRVFNINTGDYKVFSRGGRSLRYADVMYVAVERRMDEIVLQAAAEQGLVSLIKQD